MRSHQSMFHCAINNSGLHNSHFLVTAVLLHLHSFTYDFHLRTLNSFVSGRHYLLKPGFQLVSFLDDFTKYYNKVGYISMLSYYKVRLSDVSSNRLLTLPETKSWATSVWLSKILPLQVNSCSIICWVTNVVMDSTSWEWLLRQILIAMKPRRNMF